MGLTWSAAGLFNEIKQGWQWQYLERYKKPWQSVIRPHLTSLSSPISLPSAPHSAPHTATPLLTLSFTMSYRSPLPVPLIRKPKSLGSPSFRDVKPEHKYIIRFNRRVQLQQRASKPFKRMFTRERVQERECREQIQEDVVDYRATGQSPKRKAVEAVGIRRTLTRSTVCRSASRSALVLTVPQCSLPRRAMSAAPAPFFVRFVSPFPRSRFEAI